MREPGGKAQSGRPAPWGTGPVHGQHHVAGKSLEGLSRHFERFSRPLHRDEPVGPAMPRTPLAFINLECPREVLEGIGWIEVSERQVEGCEIDSAAGIERASSVLQAPPRPVDEPQVVARLPVTGHFHGCPLEDGNRFRAEREYQPGRELFGLLEP